MRITGIVVPGHGVASGKSPDPRYPDGTLALQLPFFSDQGLDLKKYYPGTINLDISPFEYKIREPFMFLKDIRWSEYIPAENFYFFKLVVFWHNLNYCGLIYMPDPETKVEHNQGNGTLELLLPKLDHLQYGDQLIIEVPDTQLCFYHKSV